MNNFFFIVFFFTSVSCSKQEDQRNIIKLNDKFKSYIPDKNAEIISFKINEDTVYHIVKGFYKSYYSKVKTSDPCPNGFDCKYYENFTNNIYTGTSKGYIVSSYYIKADPTSLPYIRLPYENFNIYLKSDYSDFHDDYKRHDTYSLNGKTYTDVIEAFDGNTFLIVYYSKKDGVISVYNKMTNSYIFELV